MQKRATPKGVFDTLNDALSARRGRYFAYRAEWEGKVKFVSARSLEHAAGVVSRFWGLKVELMDRDIPEISEELTSLAAELSPEAKAKLRALLDAEPRKKK